VKLVLRPKPEKGESFIGYLVRLTELNGYDTPSWILSLADNGRFHSSSESRQTSNSLQILLIMLCPISTRLSTHDQILLSGRVNTNTISTGRR
jgi:hypothetical protein